MQSATVIKQGENQSIQLPLDFHVDETEYYVRRIGSSLVLLSKKNPWELFERSLSEFPDDFMADGRKQPMTA
jgi:antitoxin VapB